MKNGYYRYENRDCRFSEGSVVVKLKETEKAYCFELIENTMRYSSAHLDMMFTNNKKVIVRKNKSPHAINCGEEYFVIYPYRAGIPHLFEFICEL